MGLIKTQEEIQRIQQGLTEGRFSGFSILAVTFLTRPETVRRLLPPGLLPTEQPLVQFGVTRWQRSSCIGSFDAAGVLVQARHGDIVGQYAPWMVVNTDPALVYGRDLVGEPKKAGDIKLARQGNTISASCTRNGHSALEMEVQLAQSAAIPTLDFNIFNYKYLLTPRAERYLYPPQLLRLIWQMIPSSAEIGTGQVRLGTHPLDPLAEIELVQQVSAAFLEVNTEFTGQYEMLGAVDPEGFFPHAISRMDDWSLLDNLTH